MFRTKVVENIKTHILHSVSFYEYRAVYKIMRKNIAGPDRPKIRTGRMQIACWINKAVNTHAQNMQYLLLFHCNSGCTNTPQCNLIRNLPVLYIHLGINNIYYISRRYRIFYLPQSAVHFIILSSSVQIISFSIKHAPKLKYSSRGHKCKSTLITTAYI